MGSVPRWTPQELEAYRKRLAGFGATTPLCACRDDPPPTMPYRPTETKAVPVRPKEGKQTKTEQKYNREVLHGLGRFEAVTLHLPGGGRYTPDFMSIDDGVVTFHEVKGSYRLGSQGRAFTAFHEAAAYYPMWRFVWAHWDGKRWNVRTVAEA